MSTFSQPLHQIYQSLVIDKINDKLQNCTTYLNKNELADKTANTTVTSNNPSVQIKSSSNGQYNSTKFAIITRTDEHNKYSMMYKWNNYVYYSYHLVDPLPDQQLSSDVIILVGFAVDPPPVQLTPYHIITYLNKNELADKTANTTVTSNNPSVQIKSSSNGQYNSTKFAIITRTDEHNKYSMMYKWNNYVYYSYHLVDPLPDQQLSSDVIILVGFAVDPPPVQLTPYHIITYLNKNELADKTANKVTSNNPFIKSIRYSEHSKNRIENPCNNIKDEYNKHLRKYKRSKYGYYSYQMFNPTPNQNLTSNVILLVGFAVDPPPVQHTPTITITKMNMTNVQMLYKQQICRMVTNIIVVDSDKPNIYVNLKYLYDAAVGLYLHPIKIKGASSTLGAQTFVEIPLNYLFKLNHILLKLNSLKYMKLYIANININIYRSNTLLTKNHSFLNLKTMLCKLLSELVYNLHYNTHTVEHIKQTDNNTQYTQQCDVHCINNYGILCIFISSKSYLTSHICTTPKYSNTHNWINNISSTINKQSCTIISHNHRKIKDIKNKKNSIHVKLNINIYNSINKPIYILNIH
eukprot:513404_1